MTEETVTIEIPRSALTVLAPDPVSITQRTSDAALGLPPRVFLKLCRQGAFPSTRVGRYRVALVSDVRAYLEAARQRQQPKRSSAEFLRAAGFRKVG